MQQVSKRRFPSSRAATYSKPVEHRGEALTVGGSPAADAVRLVPATCGGEINQM